MKLYIGLMSGTSMDGIDAALLDVKTNQLIKGITYPYSMDIQRRLQAFRIHEAISIAELSQLHTLLGRAFAEAVHQLLDSSPYSVSDIIAIGSHGQTVAHDAEALIPYTIQLGCPHTIAELTALPVVADFRTRDLVIGGQGAPFAPIYHQALFGQCAHPLMVINIGGIANATLLDNGEVISGYDIGPGNCLMDAWIRKQKGSAYDKSGLWAATGTVITPLLDAMLADPFFKKPFPKSIGKEYFSLDWLASYLQLQGDEPANDIQATLLALTVETISHAVSVHDVFLCGGGVHNATLFNALRRRMPHCVIESTNAVGVHPDYLEAMMFAWLADKALTSTKLDLSRITGSTKPAILGVVYPYC